MPTSISMTQSAAIHSEVAGARDIAVEFQSLSKSYAMPGWRMGFAAGNKTLIAALARIKSYLDYGAYTPVQVAATAALNGPQDCVGEMRAIYKGRRDVLVESMARAGWTFRHPTPRCSHGRRFPSRSANGFARILQTPAGACQGRCLAGHRIWRIRRRLCAHRAGGERTPHPPGRAQRQTIPRCGSTSRGELEGAK